MRQPCLECIEGRFQLPSYAKFNRPDPQRDWDWLRPHTLNLYEYVGNDPLNAWDPTGFGADQAQEAAQGMWAWTDDPIDLTPAIEGLKGLANGWKNFGVEAIKGVVEHSQGYADSNLNVLGPLGPAVYQGVTIGKNIDAITNSITERTRTVFNFYTGEGVSDRISKTFNSMSYQEMGEFVSKVSITSFSVLSLGVSRNLATVDTRKFSHYIFKEGADHGKDAVYRGLGFGREHSNKLASIYQHQANRKFASGNYTLGKLDKWGQRIDIEINLKGIGSSSGKSSSLRSGWMIQNDGTIKLSTPFSGFIK